MSDQLTSTIAKKLKQARLDRGMTQGDVAQKSGLNTNYYAKVERGEATPTLRSLEKITKALGVNSAEIMPF